MRLSRLASFVATLALGPWPGPASRRCLGRRSLQQFNLVALSGGTSYHARARPGLDRGNFVANSGAEFANDTRSRPQLRGPHGDGQPDGYPGHGQQQWLGSSRLGGGRQYQHHQPVDREQRWRCGQWQCQQHHLQWRKGLCWRHNHQRELQRRPRHHAGVRRQVAKRLRRSHFDRHEGGHVRPVQPARRAQCQQHGGHVGQQSHLHGCGRRRWPRGVQPERRAGHHGVPGPPSSSSTSAAPHPSSSTPT